MSLWDMVVKKEQVFATVEYEKRYLNVWRQDSHGYSNFNNWVKEQPKNTFDSNCAAALMQGGKWISDNCEKQKPFICEFKTSTFAGITLGNHAAKKPTKCLETWTFYNTTGYCYKAFDNATWLDAENRCNINGAHLTSIHSNEENLFVANLAYWSGADVCNGHMQGLVGLFRQEMSAQWQWTDGTAYDY
uniref:C-type lectin domain-containing protein n=1 Tax=Panagrolaimus davidi TaxID=227884 RepID=A0A914R0R4_9BILA